MQNIDKQQFSYETLKAAFDQDSRIQNLIKDFDREIIILKTDDQDNFDADQDSVDNKQQSQNKVDQMAKRAVDI